MSKRYLLVQSCHLPHFFFVAKKLREQNPDATLDALMIEHPQSHFFARLFPIFDTVFYSSESKKIGQYDAVILPLLNRGYFDIKRIALGKGPLFRVGYSGQLEPLRHVSLLLSLLYTKQTPGLDFASYYEQFPHRSGPERALVIESCHESLLPKAQPVLKSLIRESGEVTRVRKASFRTLFARLRHKEFDTAYVFLTGERGFFALKLLPFLLRVPRIVIVNENLDFFDASFRRLAGFLFERIRYGTKLPSPLPPRIVLFQTETIGYLRHAAARLKQRRLFPHSELIVVCRPEDRADAQAIPEVNRVFCYPKRSLWRYYRFWRELDRLQPDLACGIFSGRSVHRWEKVLFFCLPAPQHLAFNARLDCYQVSVTRVFWMFRSEPLVFDEQLMALAARESYILLLDTADDRKMLKAIAALRDPHIARPAPIAVFCSEGKRGLFQGLPGVKAVFTYQPKKRWDGVKAAIRLRKLNIEVLAGVFAGDPVPRLHKSLFMALPARNRLVFSADFNCFYLNRLNPLSLLPLISAGHNLSVLLIQTADDKTTLRALAKARDPRVTKPAPFVVFCREDKRELFAGAPGVEAVFTYEPKRRLRALRTLYRLFKLDVEVVTAVFTGESIFRLQKLLFFVLPARNRLVFNHNLDCYYLNRSTFWSLFRSEERLGQLSSSLLLARLLGKALLFLPRFLYLVIWVTGQKLKRAYILASEVR